ncbi:cell division protein FtsQ/DivIB [uncultured Clostridium sp.]|uniref:cell division protein FtsQ/DivIB n=1 Tax=uncultured Clostridium sp. TaxID=59620 RepID=UPI00261B4B0B|nr:FtsQ-type POTRA domain-containing protein [uncultured Clostridium sp.]
MSVMTKKKRSKKVDAYFQIKARRKRRKKIMFLIMIFIIVTILVLVKAPMFAIKGAKVTGNKMIKSEGVINQKNIKGQNIFLVDTNVIKNEILKNPYIKSAEVKRKLPNLLDINISERKMFYKIKLDSKIYVLNNELYIMDILDDDKDLAIVEVKGLKVESVKIGERITSNEKVSLILLDIATKLIDKNKDSIFTSVDVSNKSDISIFKGDIEIILGQAIDLDEKYKKAMKILGSSNIKLKDGYIDVSVVDAPVIKDNLKTDNEKDENAKIKSEEENIERE